MTDRQPMKNVVRVIHEVIMVCPNLHSTTYGIEPFNVAEEGLICGNVDCDYVFSKEFAEGAET